MAAFISGLFLVGCQVDPVLKHNPGGIDFPDHFPEPIWSNSERVDAELFELGRRLFYESALSIDSTVSCSSCHSQEHSFADHGTALSQGVFGRVGRRNSPGIFNMAYSPTFMWDGGITHLEVMPFAPITDTNEMAMNMDELVLRLKSDPGYVADFEAVQGVTEKNVYLALKEFMVGLISSGSRYDRFLLSQEELTPIELDGYRIFETHCSSCHSEPLTTNYSYASNGYKDDLKDPGRYRVTQDSADFGKFKVPSLRNVTLTYPYMHDGGIATLSQVIDHYASLEEPLQDGSGQPIQLESDDKRALLAFLETLTDYTFITDTRYAKPTE